ncbi:hypothetical protein LJC15_05740 [Desulfovibrio sp. OttesenSCG-928-G11]|nr:hypothetical protein [Desulfovibrio sp. OttesenSCG-928-G11]
MEFYRAIARGSAEEINTAHEQFRRVMSLMTRGPFEKYLFRIDEDGMYRAKDLLHLLDMMLMEFDVRPPSRRKSNPIG